MAKRIFISELKSQIEIINRRLDEIADRAYQGQLSRPYVDQDKQEYFRLLKRRRELEDRVINYEPEP
jgi:hypothetical protein